MVLSLRAAKAASIALLWLGQASYTPCIVFYHRLLSFYVHGILRRSIGIKKMSSQQLRCKEVEG